MEINTDNLIVFNDDNEFTNFCLCSDLVFKQDENTGLTYHDYEYTPVYLDAISTGKGFLIKDKNSKVLKRGCVCKGVINKKVQNLYRYDD